MTSAILIVNLNLAIDCLLDVNGLRPGEVLRARSAKRSAGGKGVNVARVLVTLGEPCLLTGFLGGESGEFIARGLREEGIALAETSISGESRTCYILRDEIASQQTVINEHGPDISSEEISAFLEDYERLLSASEIIVVTGSLPPAVPEDFYGRLTSIARRKGKILLLDTSATPLLPAIEEKPFIVKINGTEAEEALKQPVKDFAEAAEASDQLRMMGAKSAMITLGEKGALLNWEGEKHRLISPRVEAVNSVGSGDAVMAGLAAGLRRRLPATELARLAIAAGAANALHGMGRCSAEEISALQQLVVCEMA